MEAKSSPYRDMVETQVFLHWLRTGFRADVEVLIDLVERKYNHNHDEIGRFTFSTGATTGFGNAAVARTAASSNGLRRAIVRPVANSGTNPKPIVIGAARRIPSTDSTIGNSRGRITQQSTILPSKDLQARARSMGAGQNELIKTPNLHVVLFGPGVDVVPVPVATFQSFDSAARLSTQLHNLDAVITGQQSDYGIGSEGLNGQTVIGGRVYGKSAPGLYYFGSSTGLDGVSRLRFGKGDPPPTEVQVGFGGGVPLLIHGLDVSGYNIAWNRYRRNPGTGKTVVAYDSRSERLAILVQPDGRIGYSLQDVREYIRKSGYDTALLFDGSASASLNYRGDQVISPELRREPLIPMGIGLRSRRN